MEFGWENMGRRRLYIGKAVVNINLSNCKLIPG